jgi:spermidine synthase
MKKIRKNLLEITVFTCGAVLMVYELIGSRILAPYLGSSIYVWTSLIGIIMGSLSLGYWIGGRISDRNPELSRLSRIIFTASLLIFVSILIKDLILAPFGNLMVYIELASLGASILLFAPASIFLGMVSPYAVKLKMNDLKSNGATVGRLYAISTVGSIVGTFLAGFVLIPLMGSVQIALMLSLILALISLALNRGNLLIPKVALLAVVVIVLGVRPYLASANERETGIIDLDTKYNFVRIFPGTDYTTGRKTLNMMFDPTATQSAIFLEGEDDIVFEYAKNFRLAEHFAPQLKEALIIGGAAYTYPRNFLKRNPESRIDVVEIDEGLTEIAKKYFRLVDDPRMGIFHEDGRTFLNRNDKKYDVVFIDAFQSVSTIPYHLTTVEAVQSIYDALNEDGIVMMNMITGIDGDKGKFLRAEYATLKSVFPQVYVFRTKDIPGDRKQNLVMVAFKSDKKPSFSSDKPAYMQYLAGLWLDEIADDMPVLTDDYAPVDFYIRQAF